MIARNLTFVGLLIISFAAAAPVSALTFKKGQVLGADGALYEGASPEQEKALIKKAEEDGEMAGISGNNLYVVIEGDVTFVPLNDVRGKT